MLGRGDLTAESCRDSRTQTAGVRALKAAPAPFLHSGGLDGCLSIGFLHVKHSRGCHLPEEGMSQGFELYGARVAA